jgi:hypothetical protein
MVWPNACGIERVDGPERAALERVFGTATRRAPAARAALGDPLGAGGALVVALALAARRAPTAPPTDGVALFVSSSLGGSHVATVLHIPAHRGAHAHQTARSTA